MNGKHIMEREIAHYDISTTVFDVIEIKSYESYLGEWIL